MTLPDPQLYGPVESGEQPGKPSKPAPAIPPAPGEEESPAHRRSWDEVVEGSFPASDPPPTPIRIGSSERQEEAA